jgi:hypothetical protein
MSWIFSPRTIAVWMRTLVVLALAMTVASPVLLMR